MLGYSPLRRDGSRITSQKAILRADSRAPLAATVDGKALLRSSKQGSDQPTLIKDLKQLLQKDLHSGNIFLFRNGLAQTTHIRNSGFHNFSGVAGLPQNCLSSLPYLFEHY
jgi:hypothetical protein